MSTETTQFLHNRLRLWRTERGLTLYEVADLTGLSESMLSLVERGKRQLSPMAKVTVSRRLGVPVRDLFEVEAVEDEAV